VANASGRSFTFPAWSNTVARAARINAKVVAWEPDADYTDMSANTLYEYLGNVYQANTEITNVTITANSPRFFPNANVVKATTSNLTFNYGHVVSSTEQSVTFNSGNVTLGVAEVSFNFGNARLISNATAVTWSNTTLYSSDTIVEYNGNTFIAANVNATVSAHNYDFPAWSNTTPRASRLKANVVQWQPNTVYDTTSIVVLSLILKLLVLTCMLTVLDILAMLMLLFPIVLT
jgi:hypothetical protein